MVKSNLCGDLTLSDELGRGSFGKVFVGTSSEEESFAVKTLKGIESTVEIDILFRLSSPYLTHGIKIFSPQECQNQLGIVMPLLNTNMNNASTTTDPSTMQKYMYQMALGLDCLHRNNYLHLDLKPANILRGVIVPEEGDLIPLAKITDYGLAVRVSDLKEGVRTKAVKVTVVTRPPEGFIQNRDKFGYYHFTDRSDIWSLAMTYLFMAHGGFGVPYLFEGYDDKEVYDGLMKNFSQTTKRKKKLRTLLGTKFRGERLDQAVELLNSMLQIEPSKRISSAQLLQQSFFSSVKEEINSSCSIWNLPPMETPPLFDKAKEGALLLFQRLKGVEFSLLSTPFFFLSFDIYLRSIIACGSKILEKDLKLLIEASLALAFNYFYQGLIPPPSLFVLDKKEGWRYPPPIERRMIEITKLFEGRFYRTGPYDLARNLSDLQRVLNEVLLSPINLDYYFQIDYSRWLKSSSPGKKMVTIEEFLS